MESNMTNTTPAPGIEAGGQDPKGLGAEHESPSGAQPNPSPLIERLRTQLVMSTFMSREDLYREQERQRLEAAQEIERLKAEVAHFQKSGIIEIAVRNPSVRDYMDHWEARAEKAEKERDEARAEAEATAMRHAEHQLAFIEDAVADGVKELEAALSSALSRIKELEEGLKTIASANIGMFTADHDAVDLQGIARTALHKDGDYSRPTPPTDP